MDYQPVLAANAAYQKPAGWPRLNAGALTHGVMVFALLADFVDLKDLHIQHEGKNPRHPQTAATCTYRRTLATILKTRSNMRISTILILIILFSDLGLNGQTRTITGRVISEDLEPLPMVYIQNSDTLLLGKTDMNGQFIISIPQETGRLLFGYVGMEWTEIKLNKDCDTVEVVMMYSVIYDFMTLRKVDRLRKKRFDNLPSLQSDAVRNGLFENTNICYEREFKTHNPTKPVLDSLSKAYKTKRKQINVTFKGLDLGDTIRIPYSGSWREDGTDRTTLHSYSNGVDGEDFDCIIRGVITDKNKRKGRYNLACRVIDCKDCHYDNIVLNGKELRVGEMIVFNMKYFKLLRN